MTAILPIPESFAHRRDAVFAPVAGQSPFVRIVRTLASVGDVLVCAAEPLLAELRDVLSGQDFSAVRVVAAEEPGLRGQCVAAGMRALPEKTHGRVLLHDIAWPLVAPATLDRVVAALRDGAVAVLPTCPVTDSIKAVDARGAVTATVDRGPLRTVQYPRGFDATVLAQLISGSAADLFDELDAVLSQGLPVTLVDGEKDTVSFELPGDAGILTAIIEDRRGRPGR